MSVTAGERSHYQIDLNTDTTYLQTENIDDDLVPKVLQNLGGNLAPVAAGHAVAKPDKAYVYRKMCEAEFDEVKRTGGLPTVRKENSEKWLTESLDHTRQFHNKRVHDPEVVAEFRLDRKKYHEHIRDKEIDAGRKITYQHSKEARGGRNVYNRERLAHRPDKVNVGLKGPRNVEEFNKHVLSVKKINPDSFMNKTEVLRWIRRNKVNVLFTAVGIVLDAAAITISVIEDDGKFGRSTTLTVADIVGGSVGAVVGTAVAGSALGTAVAGTAIGSAIGSIFPGIGTVICGFIGGLIGSLIASGITSFFLGCNPVAPGPGQPPLDTDPHEAVFSTPKLDTDPHEAASSPPRLDTDPSEAIFPAPTLDTDPYEAVFGAPM